MNLFVNRIIIENQKLLSYISIYIRAGLDAAFYNKILA